MPKTDVEAVESFLTPPDDFVELGVVETEFMANDSENIVFSLGVQKLKELAARLGANGIILYPYERKYKKEERPTLVGGLGDSQIYKIEHIVSIYYVIRGKAIHIPEPKKQ